MVSEKITIQLATGLHARPASMLVALAKGFKSAISIRTNTKVANASSMINVLALGLKCGTEIEVVAEGDDEVIALKALSDFIKTLKD